MVFASDCAGGFGWFQIDKLGHFGLYGALATDIIRIPELKRWPALGCWWALVLASAYGMGDEFRQSLTHGVRTPDWHDWLADTIGADGGGDVSIFGGALVPPLDGDSRDQERKARQAAG